MKRPHVAYIPRTRELYAPLPPYRWVDNRGKEIPWTPLTKPLSECRVAVGTSGGVYVSGQEAFHFKDDTSIRRIPADVDAGLLRISHFGYPTADAETDANCVFPLARVRELVRDGTIKEVAPTALSWMGGIYSQRRVLSELAPTVLEQLRAERADLFYIVPA